ncbi:hypothetical protein CGRA01v4_11721 [Colletotrichum graminicola]|nr:hypothetical protein CGRA01v4_11721 [Colletotrichum graminicola]
MLSGKGGREHEARFLCSASSCS